MFDVIVFNHPVLFLVCYFEFLFLYLVYEGNVVYIFKGNNDTGEFPAQMASDAENVFSWWRHHADVMYDPGSTCMGMSSSIHLHERILFALTAMFLHIHVYNIYVIYIYIYVCVCVFVGKV